jgi:hypothetical protein
MTEYDGICRDIRVSGFQMATIILVWHSSKLPIHTMSLYIRGDYFIKSFTVLKTAVVYDKYKPNICLVYDKIVMFFYQLRFY